VDCSGQGRLLAAARAAATRLGRSFTALDRGGEVVGDRLVLADMAVSSTLGILYAGA
jgi:hypothetical protein